MLEMKSERLVSNDSVHADGGFYTPECPICREPLGGWMMVWRPFRVLLAMGSGGLLLEDCKAKRFPSTCKLASCEVVEKADGGWRAQRGGGLKSPLRAVRPAVLHSGTRWRQQPSGLNCLLQRGGIGGAGFLKAGVHQEATVNPSPQRLPFASGGRRVGVYGDQ